MLEKAQGLPVDEAILDLEDSVAPAAKQQARRNVVEALVVGDWGERLRVVRVNDWSTEWTFRDVAMIVEEAGSMIDCIMLPKVESAAQVVALGLLLSQLERGTGLDEGAIGIEVQIESAAGLVHVDEIAGASSRVETLVFGPGDFMASLNMRSLVVGGQPSGYVGDAYHYVFMRILLAAREHGLQAIDGPFGAIRDNEGFRNSAERSAALGYDGKWVLHPGQIASCNAVFSPDQEDYEQAESLLEAYSWHTSSSGGARGAAVFDGGMIDEASRKMALMTAERGRAAGMVRTREWTPPSN